MCIYILYMCVFIYLNIAQRNRVWNFVVIGAQPKEWFFLHFIFIFYKDSEQFEGTPNELIKYNLLLLLLLLYDCCSCAHNILYIYIYVILIRLNVYVILYIIISYVCNVCVFVCLIVIAPDTRQK